MKNQRLCAAVWLASMVSAFAQQPVITHYDSGMLAWSNTTATGYSSVEWASSLTGAWHKSWEWLKDIGVTPGETAREVPMFYRVVWSSSATTSPASGAIPDVSSFTATADCDASFCCRN